MLLYLIFFLLSILTKSQLVQGVILFRHGARYHLTDVFDGNSTREMWGQLTSVGMRQHYNFGSKIRNQYINKLGFLRNTYNHTEVQVHSTTVNRAITSAVSHLYGLYPLESGPLLPQGISKDLLIPPFNYNDDNGQKYAVPFGHQVIPIFTGGVMTTCDNQQKQEKKNLEQEHATVQQMNNRYKPFYQRIQRIFNLSSQLDILSQSNLFDVITVDRYLNRALPSEFSEEDYQNLLHLQTFTWLIKINKNLAKAITTAKFANIISNFDSRISNPQAQLKWNILSGHDTQIYPSLNILNISSAACVEQIYRFNKTNALNCATSVIFASSLIFELHKQSSNYLVRIKYNGQYVNLCQRADISCPYAEWKQRINQYTINFQSICGNKISAQKLELIQ